MGGEPNQAYWRGIRPTDPAENIPVDIKVCSVTLPVGIASVIGSLPVDVKAHTVNTPIVPSTPPQNIPVDVKSVTGNTPIIPSTPAQNIPVDIKSMTGNMPVDIKAHTVNTPVDIKSHDVDTPVKYSWLAQGADADLIADPVNNTVLLDSGQLTVGSYDTCFVVGCSVDHIYIRWEWRNAGNTANLKVIPFMLKSYYPFSFTIPNIQVVQNERFRLVVQNDITGTVTSGMWWTQRA